MDALQVPPPDLAWNVFLPLSKVEPQSDGSRLVFFEVNDEVRDLEGEVVSHEAMKKAAADYMQWAAVREMHEPRAVGSMLSLDIDDDLRKVTGIGRIVDPVAILKLDTGVYKGSSLGGLKGKGRMGKSADNHPARIIDDIIWTEISLVDRPSRPTAALTLMKRAKEDLVTPEDQATADAIAAASPAAVLAKAADAAPAPEAVTEPVAAPDPAPAPAVAPESTETPPESLEKSAPVSADAEILAQAMAILAKGTTAPAAMVTALHSMTAPVAPPPAANPDPTTADPLAKSADLPPAAAPVLDSEAITAQIMTTLSKSAVFATSESLEAMKADIMGGIKTINDELAKVAASPAPGGPARYATDARRTPEQGVNLVESEILAKAAQATNDPAVREELGRLAVAAQIRATLQ